MFLDWENQYCQNDHNTQGNLRIQCNPYQTANGILCRSKAKVLKHECKHKKVLIAKGISRRKTELKSKYTIKFQKLNQYGTGTKTDLQIEKAESPKINPYIYGHN